VFAAPLTEVATGPEVASETEAATLAGDWFSRNDGAGVPHETPGLVASRLIVTELLFVPPALVAVQVSVVPAVSALMVVDPQPLVEEIADSLSTTVHETVTLLVYQSLLPRVPLTLGEMTGGVVSDGPVT
jgi:hypothetical protein